MKNFSLPIALFLATIHLPIWAPMALADSVIVTEPWIRYAPPLVKSHAGYFGLKNSGQVNRILATAKSPLYERVEMHVSKLENGFATMQRVEQINIQAGKMVVFEPGGLHMMLIGPKLPQTIGAEIPITLTFQNGEEIDIKAVIKKSASYGNMHKHHKMKMN